jgi:hypothetical protein
MLQGELPGAVLFPLGVLVGGFEAIHALHVGTERIGRYLQVYYEAAPRGPRWETTAMKVGPALPGGGIDPLFSAVFAGATLLNTMPAVLLQPAPAEAALLGVLHAAFLFRIVRARRAATRQRAVELESFEALLSGERDRH